jgi:hypothetical protein
MLRREEPIPALSAGLSHVVMTGLLLFAALPALQPGARFVQSPNPLPASGTAPTSRVAPAPVESSAPPSTAPSPAAVAEASEVKDEWPQDEVARGREQCMHLLSTTAAEVELLEPIKKGPCGLPAPVRLKSVGSAPNMVVFDPPVDVNCRMVAALDRWVKTTLQPKARERMKSEVVRIVGASGYSCRNIYNLPNAKLSQHALANAIDIGGFGLANGRTVRVLKGWGLTERDIKARQAKAKAVADAKAKSKAAHGKGTDEAKAQTVAADGDGAPATSGAAGKLEKKVNPLTRASLSPASLAVAKASEPARAEQDPDSAKPTKEALFLRAIHGGACREFGTVLGPEANDPHRNHFHLDLIPRRGRGYCE